MAKASRPGNQAVAGISSEMTDEERYPTYYATATGNTQSSSSSGTGSSSNKGSTSSKSSGSTTVKNSSTSTKTSSNTGTNAGGYGYPEVQETPYDQKFYAALAAGVPNGINASEYIAKDEAADAVKGVVFTLAPSLHSFWSYFSTHLHPHNDQRHLYPKKDT